jgi:hypothetical protein
VNSDPLLSAEAPAVQAPSIAANPDSGRPLEADSDSEDEAGAPRRAADDEDEEPRILNVYFGQVPRRIPIIPPFYYSSQFS